MTSNEEAADLPDLSASKVVLPYPITKYSKMLYTMFSIINHREQCGSAVGLPIHDRPTPEIILRPTAFNSRRPLE